MIVMDAVLRSLLLAIRSTSQKSLRTSYYTDLMHKNCNLDRYSYHSQYQMRTNRKSLNIQISFMSYIDV
ncbi:MAG: hypothetical protein CLLPBCKN_001149 [Chroococcidiopsis cubana SAG 39.79]|jgi:hypothetical protein|nr:hypothetical protein [Chroococcidiopsis cubana SAG 39.79]